MTKRTEIFALGLLSVGACRGSVYTDVLQSIWFFRSIGRRVKLKVIWLSKEQQGQKGARGIPGLTEQGWEFPGKAKERAQGR